MDRIWMWNRLTLGIANADFIKMSSFKKKETQNVFEKLFTPNSFKFRDLIQRTSDIIFCLNINGY